MVKVIFFDVDGTLLSHAKKKVPDSTKRSLAKLREKGIKCVLATGRHMTELEELPVRELAFDGYITLNGQLCLDDKGTVIYGDPIVGQEKERIIGLFEERKLPLILVEKDKMYINYVDQSVREAQKKISTAIPKTGVYSGEEVYMAIAYVRKEKEDRLKALLPNCGITRWNEDGVDIIAGHGGKTTGIEQYLKQYGIGRQETMAFGDGANDAEMLRFVEIGVAMGNAEKEVKEKADYVTADIDDDGIEKAFRHFGIIE